MDTTLTFVRLPASVDNEAQASAKSRPRSSPYRVLSLAADPTHGLVEAAPPRIWRIYA